MSRTTASDPDYPTCGRCYATLFVKTAEMEPSFVTDRLDLMPTKITPEGGRACKHVFETDQRLQFLVPFVEGRTRVQRSSGPFGLAVRPAWASRR